MNSDFIVNKLCKKYHNINVSWIQNSLKYLISKNEITKINNYYEINYDITLNIFRHNAINNMKLHNIKPHDLGLMNILCGECTAHIDF